MMIVLMVMGGRQILIDIRVGFRALILNVILVESVEADSGSAAWVVVSELSH